MKYASGPWEIRKYYNSDTDQIHIDAGGVPIATVRIINLENRRKQAMPNANLIAAAPELLKALEALRDQTRDFLPPLKGFETVVEMVDKVIKKAKGKE